MNRVVYSIIAILTFFLVQNNFPQTVHDVTVSNFSFNPTQLTINAGDIVRWTNAGGLHNVVADDNSFTSGAVSSSAWVFEHTFNSVGSNPYYCGQHGGPGGVGMSGVITVEAATDINDKNITIDQYRLDQNFPNPFNPSTKITYSIPERSNVSIKVFDLLGSEVIELVNGEVETGQYDLTFNTNNLPSGIYFYKLQAGSFVETKKMILLK